MVKLLHGTRNQFTQFKPIPTYMADRLQASGMVKASVEILGTLNPGAQGTCFSPTQKDQTALLLQMIG